MAILTLVTNHDDWEGIYLDGRILDQGHQLDWESVLSSLGFTLETQDVDYDWLADQGCLPDKIEDCKFETED